MVSISPAQGVRIGWSDLPAAVHGTVADILGGPVVSAVSQPGGFSPGSADRVVTAAGRRAFVKAVSAAQNPMSPALHRQEIVVSRSLPASASAPELLGSYDDGDWVALALADVDGRHPVTPWESGELSLVLGMLARLAAGGVPAGLAQLPSLASEMADDLDGWRHLRADPPPGLDPWALSHLDLLVDVASAGTAALTADTLVHADTRADNLLISATGKVTLVDWPWACLGPVWLDTVALLVNVNLYGGHDVEALLQSEPLVAGAPASAVTGFLAGVTGFFLHVARLPDPPGLPTVRAFQQAQGDATLSWLRRRLEAS
jgi:Phosphotransferase enzyme family